jgi:hypothetical protein
MPNREGPQAPPTVGAPFFKDPTKLVISPEVHPDRRATVRLYAPQASEVYLVAAGISVTLGGPVPMTKDGDGAWSVTVGPLPPDLDDYGFSIDGGLRNLGTFSWIDVFGVGIQVADLESHFAGLIADPAETNGKLNLLWIGAGDRESARVRPFLGFPGSARHRSRVPTLSRRTHFY